MDEPRTAGRTDARSVEDEALKDALATGLTYAEAGELVGVSERTVRRRMSDQPFAAEVSRRRGEHVSSLAGLLVTAGADAVHVLRESLHDDAAAVRLRAAQLLLTLGTQLRHAHELEQRLAALEASVEPPHAPGSPS